MKTVERREFASPDIYITKICVINGEELAVQF